MTLISAKTRFQCALTPEISSLTISNWWNLSQLKHFQISITIFVISATFQMIQVFYTPWDLITKLSNGISKTTKNHNPEMFLKSWRSMWAKKVCNIIHLSATAWNSTTLNNGATRCMIRYCSVLETEQYWNLRRRNLSFRRCTQISILIRYVAFLLIKPIRWWSVFPSIRLWV